MIMFKHSKQADLMTRDREMLGISHARFFQAMMKALLLRKVGQMRDSVTGCECVCVVGGWRCTSTLGAKFNAYVFL